MRSLKRIGIACALVTNAMWGITACLPHNGRLGAGGAGDNGSVLASIGGISDKDKDRPFTYELVCGATRVKGESKADQDFARFPGDKLKDGDECALEVRVSAEEADKLAFEWYGVKGDGAPDVGLFYGSDLQKINGGKLALTLYSLAAPIVENSFTVKVNVKFEEGATIPAEATAKASLVCGETEKYPGDFKKDEGALDASLVFTNLQVKLLAGKSCSSVAILVENVVAFAGDAPDVKLDGVKKDDFKIFPDANDATKRYLVKAQAAGGGDVDTTTTAGGACLKYEGNSCKDVRSSLDVAGPLELNSWMLARVKGKAGAQGETKTFLVAAGNGVLSTLPNTSFNVSDLNDSLAASGDKAFVFFDDAADETFTKAAFNSDFIGKALSKASAESLKDMKILHIEKVFVHGMHKVTDAELNARTGKLVWLTFVKATKNAIVSEFVVTGKTPFFTSDSAPLAGGGYFDFTKVAADFAAAPGSSKWSLFALAGGAMSSADCKNQKNSYLITASNAVEENLDEDVKAPEETNGRLASCEITQAKFDQALASGFDITSESYVWEWYVAAK